MNFYPFVIASAAFMVNIYFDKYRENDLAKTLKELENDASLPRIKTYDFIIVGGGGAGCVLARGLSVFHTVLVLEAGGTPVPSTETHFYYEELRRNDRITFAYDSVPQKRASLEHGGNARGTVGKMLGGSSSLNSQIFNRGNPLIFDHWANLTKDPSWRYKNVLKYFKKLETFIGEGSRAEHGYHGPVTVDVVDSPDVKLWLNAGNELGFKTFPEPNGPQRVGFTPLAFTGKNGRRVSSYKAYLRPIEGRKRLTVERYAEVSKVLFDNERNARGVAYKRHGIPQIARARKEVIISAGTFGSPILLLKSGIGPAKVLEEAKIPLVQNLPVGASLNEHPGFYIGYFKIKDTRLFRSIDKTLDENALNDFHQFGKGIAGEPWVRGQAMIASSRAKQDGEQDWPDYMVRYTQEKSVGKEKIEAVRVAAYCTRPKSLGHLEINTTALRTGKGQIVVPDFKFFSDESDMTVLLEAVKLTFSIFENTTAFKNVGMEYVEMKHPACSGYNIRSDEYWRCLIEQTSVGFHHTTSSTRMGYGPGDKVAVVDSKLKVLGVGRLRVVGASIMPTIPNSNSFAPTLMVAEKASSDILKYWLQVKLGHIVPE